MAKACSAYLFDEDDSEYDEEFVHEEDSPSESESDHDVAPAKIPLRIPPLNFALVMSGIYRSGFPHPRNFEFLKTIGLKSVLCLCIEEYFTPNLKFMEENGIKLFHIGMPGNVEPFQSIPVEKFAEALNVVLDPANHPILVHCNKGKHRTGCLMGVLRRMCGWSLSAVFDEYARFCGSTPGGRRRYLDHQFIELFDIAPFLENVE